ncbi:hypothetical protein THAOC_33771, partial [Thalassiosira oceanica]
MPAGKLDRVGPLAQADAAALIGPLTAGVPNSAPAAGGAADEMHSGHDNISSGNVPSVLQRCYCYSPGLPVQDASSDASCLSEPEVFPCEGSACSLWGQIRPTRASEPPLACAHLPNLDVVGTDVVDPPADRDVRRSVSASSTNPLYRPRLLVSEGDRGGRAAA